MPPKNIFHYIWSTAYAFMYPVVMLFSLAFVGASYVFAQISKAIHWLLTRFEQKKN